jgi:hypothetical protein
MPSDNYVVAESIEVNRKLFCKVIEGKNMAIGKRSNSSHPRVSRLNHVETCDPFAIVKLDKKELRTPVVSNNANPFWAEDFCFEDVNDDFNQLTVTLRSRGDDEDDPDVPIGQVTFPRAALISGQLDDDQWFALSPYDIECNVSGELRIKIVHNHPSEEGGDHTISVNGTDA